MSARHLDWLRQAQRDLEHARHDIEGGFYEWACFGAQQAAEKALKAVYQVRGGEARGHSLYGLLLGLRLEFPMELGDEARELDHYYLPTRYPNMHAGGAPGDYYTRGEAERALSYAGDLVAWCKGLVVPEG